MNGVLSPLKWSKLSAVFFFLLIPAQLYAATFTGKVIRVVDGDTIHVMRSGKPAKVRLGEIDTPENNQAYGREATAFTARMVAGRIVTVEWEKKDHYGRIIGEVILLNGKSLNRELVKAGLAWWYRKYSKDESLGRLEESARVKGLGLWAEKSPISPWKFRRMTR